MVLEKTRNQSALSLDGFKSYDHEKFLIYTFSDTYVLLFHFNYMTLIMSLKYKVKQIEEEINTQLTGDMLIFFDFGNRQQTLELNLKEKIGGESYDKNSLVCSNVLLCKTRSRHKLIEDNAHTS